MTAPDRREPILSPGDVDELAAALAGKGEPAVPVDIERRHYSVSRVLRRDDPLAQDRYQLERRLTASLLAAMRADGVDIDPDTMLPGFVLAPTLPNHMEARISCDVAIRSRTVWPRG